MKNKQLKRAWAIKPTDEDRLVIKRDDFGLYMIFPSKEQAIACIKDACYNFDCEIVELEIKIK